jgi:cell division protein FtsI (penicillin-binding protein 3)
MKKAPRQTLTAPIRRARFVWVAFFFVFWVVAIVFRLGWLQIVRHSEFVERASKQQQRGFEVAPHRGVLYDRNLRELAMTTLADSVYVVPLEIGDANKAETAAMLAKVVHTDALDRFTSEEQMLARFNASRQFAWVARKVDKDTANRVRELNLKGVYVTNEFKRFYPNNNLAAQVLGYVGTDDNGLGGLELNFDDDLHGTPGHMLTAVDAKRHVLGSDEQQPMAGENLVLSIDANIQYMAEQALDAQVAKTGAAHGTVVVQDPHTGQILALAVSPRFNPNDARHMDAGALTNLAVSDVYEPGSTFKLVTYAAALDGGNVQPTDMVDCQGGAMTLFGRTIHDDKSDHYGVITVQQALEHSSDVGAVKMVQKIGNAKFYQYMKGFGFGERSGIELPSETRGLLRPVQKWGATSFMSMAIGQEVGVTPVQLVTMVSTIANGGVYMPPHILLASTDEMKGDPRLKPDAFHPANQLPATLPDGAHRVISEMSAAKMRSMMQGIVIEGTGKAAQLNGYSSGGKTGTAQKIDPKTHTYSHTLLVASFAGIAPVSSPAISIAVIIDSPQGSEAQRYGAYVSAPVFRDVAQQVLEYLGVPHDMPLKTPKEMQALAKADTHDDVPSDQGADLTAMFEQINSLPADDPLRQPANSAAMAANTAADEATDEAAARSADRALTGAMKLLPTKVLAAFHANGNTTSVMPDAVTDTRPLEAPKILPAVQTRGDRAVVIDPAKRVAVPVFVGDGLRAVVQHANAAGLTVQPVGSGLAREQVPAAGTMVPVGTEIVVRFTR